jgi:exopolysaccharide biosynthesis polyprenyl glycosylphosphotransferase
VSFTLNTTGAARTLGRTRPVRPAAQIPRATGRARPVATAFGDVIVMAAASTALVLAAVAAGRPAESGGWLLAFDATLLVVLWRRGAYRFRLHGSLLEDAGRVVVAGAVAATVVLAARSLVATPTNPGTDVVRFWAVTSLFLLLARLVRTLSARRALATGGGRPTLIVGAGRVGHLVARRLLDRPELGLRPVGFLDSEPLLPGPDGPHLPVLGATWNLDAHVRELGVEHVVVSFSTDPSSVHLDLLRRCQKMGLAVSVVPRLFEEMTGRLEVEFLGGLPMVCIQPVRVRSWQFSVKYALDRVLATAVLVVVAPLMAVAAAAVRLSSGGPVLYRQVRVGLNGRPFEMLKFRTMVGSPEADGEADAAWVRSMTAGDGAGPLASPPIDRATDRTTRVGHILRRLSVDELPQLFNVLRGDMSIVGPRPERMALVPGFEQSVYRYTDRHRVKAGMTGWAQVHGLRGETSLRDRIEWDNHYIQNWTPWLDLKIILLTVPALLRGWQKD